MEVKPLSTFELMEAAPEPELILLAGKDGVGKTSALVSLAKEIEDRSPDAKVYVADSENKFKGILQSFGADAPQNILYYKCDSVEQITDYLAYAISKHKPGDWFFADSLTSVWERAQDLAYRRTSGKTKKEYLAAKPKSGPGSGPIPQPDDFWKIAKRAYDGDFFDLLTSSDTLNSAITTTVAKPKDIPGRAENKDRKALRIEFGIDMNLGGAPLTPYRVRTLIMMELVDAEMTARVIRDNKGDRTEFPVPDKKSFGPMFWATCRS